VKCWSAASDEKLPGERWASEHIEKLPGGSVTEQVVLRRSWFDDGRGAMSEGVRQKVIAEGRSF
jgi:hypothetical protein